MALSSLLPVRKIELLFVLSAHDDQTDEAAATVFAYGSRLCALEGLAGNGEQANVRVRRHGRHNAELDSAVGVRHD